MIKGSTGAHWVGQQQLGEGAELEHGDPGSEHEDRERAPRVGGARSDPEAHGDRHGERREHEPGEQGRVRKWHDERGEQHCERVEPRSSGGALKCGRDEAQQRVPGRVSDERVRVGYWNTV